MPEFVRVRDKATGHEYTIRAARFNDAAHVEVDKPALDAHGDPAAPKYRTTVRASAAKKTAAKKTAAKKTTAPRKRTAAKKTATQADTTKAQEDR